jgi:hypothetical protein
LFGTANWWMPNWLARVLRVKPLAPVPVPVTHAGTPDRVPAGD